MEGVWFKPFGLMLSKKLSWRWQFFITVAVLFVYYGYKGFDKHMPVVAVAAAVLNTPMPVNWRGLVASLACASVVFGLTVWMLGQVEAGNLFHWLFVQQGSGGLATLEVEKPFPVWLVWAMWQTVIVISFALLVWWKTSDE